MPTIPTTSIPTSSPTKVLVERSPNTSSPSKQDKQEHKAKENSFGLANMFQTQREQQQPTGENHQQQSAAAMQEPGQTYHSPSDNILSPTSKKLSEIKGKRFASGKPQSLFAKTVRKEGMKSQDKLLSTAGAAKN